MAGAVARKKVRAAAPVPALMVPVEDWPAAQEREWRDPAQLKSHPRNARIHPQSQIEEICASIAQHGFAKLSIVIDETDTILAGHGNVVALKRFGAQIARVPVTVVRGWSDDQKRAFMLRDNKIAENSEWNLDLVAEELAALEQGAAIDIKGLGFSSAEMRRMKVPGFEIGRSAAGRSSGEDDADDQAPQQAISRVGDLWIMGAHRVLCGNALDADDLAKLLNGKVPDIANCDTPYGVSAVAADGRTSGRGPSGFAGASAKYIAKRVYAPIIGDDTTETAVRVHAELARLGVPVIVLWGGNYFANQLPPSKCWLVWDKETSGIFATAELAWTNQDRNVQLLHHKWNGMVKASERDETRVHPTQKPIALAEWVIDTLAPNAKTALDLFLGSGSTLLACERKGVACYGMDLAPDYIDVTIRRWQKKTGGEAILAATGEKFADVATSRAAAPGSL